MRLISSNDLSYQLEISVHAWCDININLDVKKALLLLFIGGVNKNRDEMKIGGNLSKHNDFEKFKL
jgi:DNA replicative helicase MCM subunit Mcm2 (Cdc46/Mcm family)